MTMHLRPPYPRLSAPAATPLLRDGRASWRVADISLWILAALALLAVSLSGSNTPVTPPLAVLWHLCVPVAALCIPLRLSYRALRHRLSKTTAVLLAMACAACVASGLDATLRAGPDGRAAAHKIVANQPALLPVPVPAHGIIGLHYDGPGWQRSGCAALCEALLTEGTATRVLNYDRSDTPFQAFYLVDVDGGCLHGDAPTSTNAWICEHRNPSERTELRFDLVYTDPPADAPALTAIYHVTVRSGALVQHTKMVSAEIATGGGLLAPFGAANDGDGFFSETRTVNLVPDAMADLYAGGAWDHSMMGGFNALVLSLVP